MAGYCRIKKKKKKTNPYSSNITDIPKYCYFLGVFP